MSISVVGKNRELRSSRRSTFFRRLTIGVTLLVGIVGLSILLVISFGRCAGEEFSAGDFSRREFYYFRIPLVKLQLTPIYRRDKTNSLVKQLQNKQLISKVSNNWKLARLNAGADKPYLADELILCQYLDQRNHDNNLSWLDWSHQNPTLARVFWPIISRVSHEGLYVLIPDLFQLARFAEEPVPLDIELRKFMIPAAAKIAAGEHQRANYDRAAQIAALVLMLADNKDLRDERVIEAAQSAAATQTEAFQRGAKIFACESLPSYDPEAIFPLDQGSDQEPPDAAPVQSGDNRWTAEDSVSTEADGKGWANGPTPNDSE